MEPNITLNFLGAKHRLKVHSKKKEVWNKIAWVSKKSWSIFQLYIHSHDLILYQLKA